MDRHPQVQTRGDRNSRNVTVTTKPKLFILSQNIQSIGNKQIEVDLALKSNLKNIDVLCFTEHWLKEDYLKLIHIDQYELVSYFSRTQHNHGGSCIYVGKNICTNNLNCFQDISAEDFKVSVNELVDYNYIIVCNYRSPDGNFWIFLKNLEFILHTIQFRNKKPLLCGNWNLNFLVNNKKLQELQLLLESYNMMNIVRSTTGITPSSLSLIDVIITSKDSPN
jgi:exonuclease III